LLNPFTPSEIASAPEDFFGRTDELKTLERALTQGSVAIQGPIGIGKSSLLARGRLLMEGFDSDHRAKSVVAVGDRDVQTIDSAARLLLEAFVRIDERQNKVTFKLGSVFEIESAEICRYFKENHHLAALKRIVEEEYLNLVIADKELLLLAIDEADKCPVALARLIRSIATHTQQQGVKRVRFILAGVSPFFQKMVDEDNGISRFFYTTITLRPMQHDEAVALVETKLMDAVQRASLSGYDLQIDPTIVSRVADLSGGHPHILQLLGSHLIEHEDEDPDGIIDSRDLYNSLRRICYDDRARIYDSTIHELEVHAKLDGLRNLLTLVANRGFPTTIDRERATDIVGPNTLQWLVDHDVLSVKSAEDYGLVDEFLRLRLIFDESESAADQEEWERQMIRGQIPTAEFDILDTENNRDD
jgi:hypothetical protein